MTNPHHREIPLPANERVRIVEQRVLAVYFGADGRVSGHDTCNPMKGNYTLQGDRIKFSPIATGRITCAKSAWLCL